jgi:hypothetical protein
MPFLTTMRTGQPLFQPAVSDITGNFVIADNGGSQGVDNDDGSSHYAITGNFFYQADGSRWITVSEWMGEWASA